MGGPPFGSIGDDVSNIHSMLTPFLKLTLTSQIPSSLVSALGTTTLSKTSTSTRSCTWATIRMVWAASAATLAATLAWKPEVINEHSACSLPLLRRQTEILDSQELPLCPAGSLRGKHGCRHFIHIKRSYTRLFHQPIAFLSGASGGERSHGFAKYFALFSGVLSVSALEELFRLFHFGPMCSLVHLN
jgi:hypothetical protein